MHVLICEDDPVLALHLEELVREAGYRPFGPARTRLEARDMAASQQPAVALVDLHLEDGHTGPQLAEELAAAGTRVVVISGDMAVDPRLATIDHVFLSKPVSAAILHDVLAAMPRTGLAA